MRRRSFLQVPFLAPLVASVQAQELSGPPIAGLTPKDLRDTFYERRGSGRHEAMDLIAPRGTPVFAVVSGAIRKLFHSKPGGLTIYLFDEQERFCYYYAHLDGYRADLREGARVKTGELIAYVGSTGNADPLAPHLHLAIFELGPEKQWWKGTPLNPFRPVLRAVNRQF